MATSSAQQADCRLTSAVIQQINEKLQEAAQQQYAEIVLVVKRGQLRYIRSGVSEPIRAG